MASICSIVDTIGTTLRTCHDVIDAMYQWRTPEETSLEDTRLGVSQDMLFRYNLSMKNRGLIVYETLRE
jgi:hypothetical protein